MISVDTKTKELVGNFKNPGRCWRRQERAVLDHDFRRYAVGVGIPYGIYDEGRNAGFVVLGVSHDTAAFAIAAIRQRWLQVGQKHYSKAKRWLMRRMEADRTEVGTGCGKRDCKRWRTNFSHHCCIPYPAGASKWIRSIIGCSALSARIGRENLWRVMRSCSSGLRRRDRKLASLVVLVWIVAVIPPEVDHGGRKGDHSFETTKSAAKVELHYMAT